MSGCDGALDALDSTRSIIPYSDMPKSYIITLMAANRVGILAAVTTALADLGGDLHEVSQTVMRKFFTIILAAEFPSDRAPAEIVEHIHEVCRPYGVEVCLKDPAAETLQPDPAAGTEKHILTISGSDQPGLVRDVTARLAQQGIDVTDLYAVRSGKARSASKGPSFQMILELAVPPDVDCVTLRRELEEIGRPQGLSAALVHENIFAATNDPRPVWVDG